MEMRFAIHSNKYDLIVYSEPSGRAAAMPLRGLL